MIEIQDAKDDRIIEVYVTETLTEADFDHLEPVLKKQVTEVPHSRLLLIMQKFSGWKNAGTFWRDLQIDSKYIGEFERIALVGDTAWEEWLTKLINPLISNEVKYFNTTKMPSARNWLRQ